MVGQRFESSHRFLILFWVGHLCRSIEGWRNFSCLVERPVTLALQRLKEDRFKLLLIIVITSPSSRPKRRFMASKGVLSSHAISMMRSKSGVFLLTSGFSVLAGGFFRSSCILRFLTHNRREIKGAEAKNMWRYPAIYFLTSWVLFTKENLWRSYILILIHWERITLVVTVITDRRALISMSFQSPLQSSITYMPRMCPVFLVEQHF